MLSGVPPLHETSLPLTAVMTLTHHWTLTGPRGLDRLRLEGNISSCSASVDQRISSVAFRFCLPRLCSLVASTRGKFCRESKPWKCDYRRTKAEDKRSSGMAGPGEGLAPMAVVDQFKGSVMLLIVN